MGKRKGRGEFGRERSTEALFRAQKLKSREFVDFNEWIQGEAASLEFNNPNPNPAKESRIIIDVNIRIQLEEAARELNKHNPKHTNESRVKISEPVVSDKSPEASRMKKYAITALAKIPFKEDFELVQIGPLAVGDLSGTHRILHLNFKSKRLSGSGEGDAVVATYFCELTETTLSDHVSALHCCYVAPSHLLPEKADTCGCLYCSSCNIHHPTYSSHFFNGWKPYLETLTSKLNEIDTYLRQRKRNTKADFIKKFCDPGLEDIDDGTSTEVSIDRFPNVALRMYNSKQGSNFELVKIGKSGVVHLKLGFVYHWNFEARKKDDVDGPVHTFFAQVIQKSKYLLVDFCSCLGPTYLLPDEPDYQGCNYCKTKIGIHHPPGPGYLVGRESAMTSALRSVF